MALPGEVWLSARSSSPGARSPVWGAEGAAWPLTAVCSSTSPEGTRGSPLPLGSWVRRGAGATTASPASGCEGGNLAFGAGLGQLTGEITSGG